MMGTGGAMTALLWAWACGGDDPTGDSTDTPVEHSSITSTGHTGQVVGHTGATGSTASTASTAHTGEVPFDCTTAPATHQGVRQVPGPRGYHGLAFDLDGYIYGIDVSTNLIRADFYGNGNVFLPGEWIQGMDTLPSGEIVIAAGSGLVVVDPVTLGTRRIATGLGGVYGLIVGPDGMVYVGDRYDAWRVDPVADTYEVYLPGSEAQSVGFSPDGTKFYYTTTFGYALWQVDLDASYDPVGAPTPLANFGSSYRDGLAVDICGNIYVTDYGVRKMFKIEPTTGTVDVFVNFVDLSNYGHFAVFGSGIGGWRNDAIYVPQPYNNHLVGEIIVGVPGLPFP